MSFNEAGAVFLMISPGARAVAMGSAFTALADDAVATYYNPAGLGFQEHASAVAMNSVFLPGLGQVIYKEGYDKNIPRGPAWLPGLSPGMRYSYIATSIPVSDKGAFGVAWTYMNVEPYYSYDYALTFAYGRRILKKLGLGFSCKYIYSFLCPAWLYELVTGVPGGTATVFTYDWGILYKVPGDIVSLGLSGQNFGHDKLQYSSISEGDLLPKLIRTGIASKPMLLFSQTFLQSEGRISFDVVSDLVGKKHDQWYSVGVELVFQKIFSYRVGYFCDAPGYRKGVTGGVGISVASLSLDIANDSDIYEFDTSNWRVAISIRNGGKTWEAFSKNKLDKKTEKIVDVGVAGASSLVIPGGGQFYNGEEVKGVLFFLSAFALGEIYFEQEKNSERDAVPITLGTLHILSIVDAIYTALKRNK